MIVVAPPGTGTGTVAASAFMSGIAHEALRGFGLAFARRPETRLDFDSFRSSLTAPAPPADLAPPLRALWQDARGHWDRAHEIAQDIEGPEGSWIHAYLHRKEGDAGNAAYWYRRAGKPICRDALESEWEAIARALTEGGGAEAER